MIVLIKLIEIYWYLYWIILVYNILTCCIETVQFYTLIPLTHFGHSHPVSLLLVSEPPRGYRYFIFVIMTLDQSNYSNHQLKGKTNRLSPRRCLPPLSFRTPKHCSVLFCVNGHTNSSVPQHFQINWFLHLLPIKLIFSSQWPQELLALLTFHAFWLVPTNQMCLPYFFETFQFL